MAVPGAGPPASAVADVRSHPGARAIDPRGVGAVTAAAGGVVYGNCFCCYFAESSPLELSMANRARVWLVDDREENRVKFIERHESEFDVRTFESPDQLMKEIQDKQPPDALLCDIFYYHDAREREEVEKRVEQAAKEIESLASVLRADVAAEGIPLIERVRHHFHDEPPFPIYAYTSKGPYLLHNDSFDRLEKLNARWLFKNRYSPQVELHRIMRDVKEFRERNVWSRRAWDVAWRTGIVMALAGAFLGVLIDRLARHFGI